MQSGAITTHEWDIWRTFYTMRRQLDLELERQLQRDADISGADYEVLAALLNAPGRRMRVRELGRALGWEKSRVSHQLSRMERRNLVARESCDTDARGTWATITPNGRRAVLGAMRDHGRMIRSLFLDALSDDEKETFLAVSRRVLDRISPAADQD